MIKVLLSIFENRSAFEEDFITNQREIIETNTHPNPPKSECEIASYVSFFCGFRPLFLCATPVVSLTFAAYFYGIFLKKIKIKSSPKKGFADVKNIRDKYFYSWQILAKLFYSLDFLVLFYQEKRTAKHELINEQLLVIIH